MAITITTGAASPIGLDEYLDYVERHVDPEDQDSVIASAPRLHELSLNRDLLVDTMNRNLESLRRVDRTNVFYSAHSFVLGSRNKLVVRGNIWPVVSKFDHLPHRAKHVNKVYAYDYPHDHNFDFVTVGWFGPGYVTDIYEYDRCAIAGVAGESVPLRFLERTALSEGKAMVFRKSCDVHVQYPPESVSVSLNLLVRSACTQTEDQFIFDIERQRISGYVTGSEMSRIALTLQFASVIGDQRTRAVLTDLMTSSRMPRIRAAAYRAIRDLEGYLPTDVAKVLDSDPSPFAAQVRNELRELVVAG